MTQAQDTLGVPHDAQQMVYKGQVLKQNAIVSAAGLTDGAIIQMAVGKRRTPTAQMVQSPGGSWR